jgi:hypothetical protein
MTPGPTLILYLLIGAGVAGAIYVTGTSRHAPAHWFQVTTAILFWPLYLPILLTRTRPVGTAAPAEVAAAPDEMTAAIAQVESEVEAALHSLDGWAEDVLNREQDRLNELRSAWKAQAARIREMDALLGRPGNGADASPEGTGPESERLRHSAAARRQNIERLKQVRERTYQDLMITLSWVRELVSMIHLAKFTGAPASRAEELVAQIAAAVEGLSALTWQDEPLAPAGGST